MVSEQFYEVLANRKWNLPILGYLISNSGSSFSEIKNGLGIEHSEQVRRPLNDLLEFGIIRKKMQSGDATYIVDGAEREYLLIALEKWKDSLALNGSDVPLAILERGMNVYGVSPTAFPQVQSSKTSKQHRLSAILRNGPIIRTMHLPITEPYYAPWSDKFVTENRELAMLSSDNYPSLAYRVKRDELFPKGKDARLGDVLGRVMQNLAALKKSERRKRAEKTFGKHIRNIDLESREASLFVKKNRKILFAMLAEIDSADELERRLIHPISRYDEADKSSFCHVTSKAGIRAFTDGLAALVKGEHASELSHFLGNILDDMQKANPDLYPLRVSLVCHSNFMFPYLLKMRFLFEVRTYDRKKRSYSQPSSLKKKGVEIELTDRDHRTLYDERKELKKGRYTVVNENNKRLLVYEDMKDVIDDAWERMVSLPAKKRKK